MKQPANLTSLIAAYADVLNRKAAEERNGRTEASAAIIHPSGKERTIKQVYPASQ